MSSDPVISPRELAALIDVVIFDCRQDAGAYRAGHVHGAASGRGASGAAIPSARASRRDSTAFVAAAASIDRAPSTAPDLARPGARARSRRAHRDHSTFDT
jgi:hypothetical protein